MGAPTRPSDDEVRTRLRAWADEWLDVAGSTERADRPRAEAAITGLYKLSGHRPPSFHWVASPAEGVTAYAVASLAFPAIRNPYAVGDVGNGYFREFNGLADPFGLPPDWMRRLARNVVALLPEDRQPPGWSLIEPDRAAAEGLGLGGTARMLPVLRALAETGRTFEFRERSDEAAVDAAIELVGDGWHELVSVVGESAAFTAVGKAMRAAMGHVLNHGQRLRDARQAMQAAQWDTRSPSLMAAREVFGAYLWRPMEGRRERVGGLELRLELARSVCAWWALDGLAIMSERPLAIRRDDRGRLHCSDGPAVAWADGTRAFAWHGVRVREDVIMDPSSITVGQVDREENVEVRRVLVERFGEERLLREGGARLVHADETGRLWRRRYRMSDWRSPEDDQSVTMVEVINSTPEPDGSRRTYFLRVPPTMSRAREAVAWTFGLDEADYAPERQT